MMDRLPGLRPLPGPIPLMTLDRADPCASPNKEARQMRSYGEEVERLAGVRFWELAEVCRTLNHGRKGEHAAVLMMLLQCGGVLDAALPPRWISAVPRAVSAMLGC